MRKPSEVVLGVIDTEKSQRGLEQLGEYTFRVAREASRGEIASAVEVLFGVNVKRVRTCVMHGEWRRRGKSQRKLGNWKKARVRLQNQHRIEGLFEAPMPSS